MAFSQIKNGSSILLENQQGTDAGSANSFSAFSGALEQYNSPHWVDLLFPAFAFLMVIIVPSLIAMWVIYKTLREKNSCEDESKI
jgi:hypothetical protein